jgi:ribosomal protein S9
MEVINAIGRRKAAIARVFVTPGTGKIVINKREFDNYFPSTILQYVVKQPLAKLDVTEKYILSVGNSVDLNQAFKDFTGRTPDIKPLLQNKGFVK